jgi:trafficking protein particle complex subunit 5
MNASLATSPAGKVPFMQSASAASVSQTSLPPRSSQSTPTAGLRVPSNRKTIYDRNLNRSRTAELSRASFAYLFAEMVTYAQKRVTGIQDLERRSVTLSIICPLSVMHSNSISS